MLTPFAGFIKYDNGIHLFGESVSLDAENWGNVWEFLEDVTNFFFLKFEKFGKNRSYNPEFVIFPKSDEFEDNLDLDIIKEILEKAYDTECIDNGTLTLKTVNNNLVLINGSNNAEYFDFEEENLKIFLNFTWFLSYSFI